MYASVREISKEDQVGRWEGALQRVESAPAPQPTAQLLGSPAALVFIGILALMLVLGVILPAVWSRNPERRSAAFKVMDRIFKLMRRRS
ncbi:hypothetical protein AB0L65_30295 [Nonomuraea sp. NPDC052116]|uniref:hypothetical protein n=1 Tax=Nonomuraea sp. NPDC052116 TaxID=3155665 RepID=UPI003445E81A